MKLTVPTLDYNFFLKNLQGILKEAEKRKYLVIIFRSN
jgi:LacI family transcriptional regulator